MWIHSNSSPHTKQTFFSTEGSGDTSLRVRVTGRLLEGRKGTRTQDSFLQWPHERLRGIFLAWRFLGSCGCRFITLSGFALHLGW
uniref:Uncharacterized protein n=1 Tax=Steinernema glaseri TaxID=37863 RepID=A0A1I8AHF1_9BILA